MGRREGGGVVEPPERAYIFNSNIVPFKTIAILKEKQFDLFITQLRNNIMKEKIFFSQ